jgi:hypothetical protein
MATAWWHGRPGRAARLVLWFVVTMLLAGGVLAYSCARDASGAAGSAPNHPPGPTVTAVAGE